MVSGIEHTAIASPDPRRLAQWYVEHLGFVINYQSASSSTTFVKAPDGSMIEIIESKGALPGVPAMRDPGIRHMALTVADFDAAYAGLRARTSISSASRRTKGATSWCSSPIATAISCTC